MLGGGVKITTKHIKQKDFLHWIKTNTQDFFKTTKRGFGGLITFNDGYKFIYSDFYDETRGDILWTVNMVDNIQENQIIWHTHNMERGFKCEPPSGADITVMLDIAKEKQKFPIGISIGQKGIWIYHIKDHFNEKIEKDFEGYKKWVSWIVNTVATLFCYSNIDIDDRYHVDDI